MRLVSSFALLAVLVAGKAAAVEGGLGRSITGLQATNYAGVIPPDPGWSLAFGYAYYSGDIGAERELPISGVTALGMSATFDLFSLTGMYVWDTGEGRWNFASMVTVPVANVDVGAGLVVGPIQRSIDDSVHGRLYDMSFAPVVAGYHFDETRHLSLSLNVSAPTGSYDPDRLANPSLNAWVYTPMVAYTQLAHKGSLEWTTVVGIDFSSWNHATDYRSGAIFHVDSLLVKSFASGWGMGGSGGWIEQIEDDSGALADRFNGFRGSALALGPIVTYQGKWAGSTVAFSARWLKEFDVKRRLEGDPLMVTASITF